MNIGRQTAAALLLAALLGTPAAAQEPTPVVRTHNPGYAATAALLNIGYIPLRFAVTAVGGVLGGFTGFITMGDHTAADGIWAFFDGSQVITPEMLQGTEEFRWTGLR